MKTLTPSLSSGELMISRIFGTNNDTGDESSGFVETKDADGPVAVDLTEFFEFGYKVATPVVDLTNFSLPIVVPCFRQWDHDSD